jgi:hypothetical protein
MAITFTGTTGTFSDGSTQTGSYPSGVITPDYNTSNTSQSYNVGYLAFANTVFLAGSGYYNSGLFAWGLNRPNYSSSLYDSSSANVPFVNLVNSASAYSGSQSFYLFTNQSGTGGCAGTWRARGQALNTGLYQYYGNFVLLERVA